MKRFIYTLLAVCCTAAMLQAQNIVGRYAWEGTLDGKIAIRLAIEVNDQGIVAGSIFYPKARNAAPILVAGGYHGDTHGPIQGVSSGFITLSEYLADGRLTGLMSFSISNGLPVGTWTDPKTNKEYHFQGMRKIAFPKAYGGKLTPEAPGNIGHRYSFNMYNPGYNDYLGGYFEFRAAGKNRVHFSASNVTHNIAEGASRTGRPAVLQGNYFSYSDMDECGDGFEAYFFPLFMVVRTTDYDPMNTCFGMGASLEGIYIKTKK